MEIHEALNRLKRLNMAPYICTLYEVDKQDLELLAAIEEHSIQPLNLEEQQQE